MSYKIIVAGGREFDDYSLLEESLTEFLVMSDVPVFFDGNDDIEIVCGGARGADTLGEKFAKEYGFKVKYFYPDWGTHGNKAGILRNHEMGDYADALVAYWDGQSRGTKDMITYAKTKKLDVHVVKYK